MTHGWPQLRRHSHRPLQPPSGEKRWKSAGSKTVIRRSGRRGHRSSSCFPILPFWESIFGTLDAAARFGVAEDVHPVDRPAIVRVSVGNLYLKHKQDGDGAWMEPERIRTRGVYLSNTLILFAAFRKPHLFSSLLRTIEMLITFASSS